VPAAGDVGVLMEALKELKMGDLPGGAKGITLKGVPFEWAQPPAGVTLEKGKGWAMVSIGRSVQEVWVLQAVVGQGAAKALHHCRIPRLDGTVVDLKWEWGKNIAPSVGEWKGTLAAEAALAKTEVAWESSNGKTRLFLTKWENDNQWYPVKYLEWGLDDESATVIILGVTVK